MFGVSIQEILVICVVILIVLGPDRLPQAARTAGNLLAQFRRQADAVRRELYNTVYEPAEDFRNDFRAASEELRAVKESAKNILPLSAEETLTCEDKARFEQEKQSAKDSETLEDQDSKSDQPASTVKQESSE
ncbi:MAG: twin-arginine translocase subunit TatB [Bdellovibrionales bacterium]|nr:twin-arginine translocase subunit TatB [Bdellovibrionales bacterium]